LRPVVVIVAVPGDRDGGRSDQDGLGQRNSRDGNVEIRRECIWRRERSDKLVAKAQDRPGRRQRPFIRIAGPRPVEGDRQTGFTENVGACVCDGRRGERRDDDRGGPRTELTIGHDELGYLVVGDVGGELRTDGVDVVERRGAPRRFRDERPRVGQQYAVDVG
jgi:hypothetical protein